MKFTSIRKLEPGMILAQNMVGITQADKYVTGTVLTKDDILFFRDKGIFGVYTIEANIPEILSPDLMQKCLTALAENDFDEMLILAIRIVGEVTKRSHALDFRSIRSYEDYLLHHSICVAVYAVAIGMELGLKDERLFDVALAGLLHDVGKTQLDPFLLVKKETLTAAEYDEIKRHPEQGCAMLKGHALISNAVIEGILHHHENANGTGYPAGQREDDISDIAKILHVADVYDAIMTLRPYKKGMSEADAINYLIGGKTILFDEKVVDAFLKVAIPYPSGCEVRLSNKQTALVVNQTENTQRPLIYFEEEQRLIDLSKDEKYKDINILCDTDYEKVVLHATGNHSSSNGGEQGKKKILIVDDVFVSIAHTKHALTADYEVISCLDATKAAATAAAEKPDLILMDYEMPNMSGVDAVQAIRKRGIQTPIIFLTGKNDHNTVKACIQCGAADYILKPANPVYLRTRIEMILHNIDIK